MNRLSLCKLHSRMIINYTWIIPPSDFFNEFGDGLLDVHKSFDSADNIRDSIRDLSL